MDIKSAKDFFIALDREIEEEKRILGGKRLVFNHNIGEYKWYLIIPVKSWHREFCHPN